MSRYRVVGLSTVIGVLVGAFGNLFCQTLGWPLWASLLAPIILCAIGCFIWFSLFLYKHHQDELGIAARSHLRHKDVG